MISHRSTLKSPPGSPTSLEHPVAVRFEESAAANLNARAVEFIAKPGKTDELRSLLCQSVTPLLRDRTGFIRMIILTKQEERRRVLVITLWSTQEHAVSDPWEQTPLIRELLSPLIDAWSSTQTCEVDFTEAEETHSQATALALC